MTETERFFRFKMDSGRNLDYMPGQFFELTVPGIGEAPISISSSPTRIRGGEFEMVIRRVGNVTRALHALEAGAKVGIRGPFGSKFPVDETMLRQDLLFVCGGIGLVPVRSSIHYVLDHREDYGRITILSGTRSPSERLFSGELEAWAQRDDLQVMETVDTADDAWTGNVGVITTLIPQVDVDPQRTVAIVCGPPIMYKFVLIELDKRRLPFERVYVSLERNMKCGVGKCGHCQINNLYACQDGPVFAYADLVTVKEAI
jgi:NAD(P)H-flavin reductase